ncbi:MAG: hypothetical protein J6Y78_00060 [Paludibacteraceae bacterium]|nr:hypothetical protein [Paludibacteraceae bacterium]
MSLFGSSKKEFMTFQSYEKADFGGIPIKEYQVMINPEQFSKSMSATFNHENAMTNSVSAGRFSNMQPIDYNFTLMLDGTGVVPTHKEQTSVKEQLKNLTEVLFKEAAGGIGYEPYYVAITYCDEVFHCVVTSFKTDYTLFKPDGSPLRAKVTCGFKSICMKEPHAEPQRKTDAEKTNFEKFKDALSESIDNALDSLFNLPRI